MAIKNWMKSKIQAAKAHQNKAFDEVNGLIIKKRRGKKVFLNDTQEVLTEFVSCSYMGLDQDERLIKAVAQDVQDMGVSFHAARTRIQPFNNVLLESLLNQVFCDAHSITYPTIHMAHLGFLPLLGSGEVPSFPLAENGAFFLVDKSAHSSMQINRGLMEQFGKVERIDFQEVGQLKAFFSLAASRKETPIAIGDGIGSMGGAAPVLELLKLAEAYNGYVYLDDAHGTSVHGKNGCGFVLKCTDYYFHPRLAMTVTLGKAFGSIGGALLLPTQADANFTKRFSPTYLFGGPPALPIINAAIASAKIHLSDEIYKLQNKLWDNIRYFDSLLHENIINANTASPVRGIFIGDEFKAIQFAKQLRERGFLLTTAMYPTVAKGQSMLRVAISSAHKKREILALCQHIKELTAYSNIDWLENKTLVPQIHDHDLEPAWEF